MNKKILIPIIAIVILAAGVGGCSISRQKSAVKKSNSERQTARCGDGVCDEKEKVSPKLCPKDCGSEKNRGEVKKSGSEENRNKESDENGKINNNQPKNQAIKSTVKFSPFGIMAAFDLSTLSFVGGNDEYKVQWAGNHFQNLGAKWSRGGGEKIIWEINEPELGKGYDWSVSDEVLKRVYQNGGNGFNMIVNICSSRARGTSADIPASDETYFKNYIKTLVERYDGDGINDYDPSIKVKYWQLGNEPFPRHWEENGGTIEGYTRFVELSVQAIRDADSSAKIILGTCQLDTADAIAKFNTIVSALKNKNLFDYADTHYWAAGDNYKIPLGEARSILDSNGYSYVKIMSLEYGTWTGRDGETEREQANYLIKGYAYNLANGFSMLNWNNLVEWNNFGGSTRSIYNFMGLIADGMNGDTIPAGTSRLSYYTYKKMVEVLEGSDWDNIQTIQESDNVYIYKFTKNSKSIWVAWNDNSTDKQITISGINSNQVKITEAVPKYESGKDVTDYDTAFETEIKTAQNNKISITLGDVPVFVEEK